MELPPHRCHTPPCHLISHCKTRCLLHLHRSSSALHLSSWPGPDPIPACCSMSRTVFVGNLPLDTRERELEDLFYKYGRITDLDLKWVPTL